MFVLGLFLPPIFTINYITNRSSMFKSLSSFCKTLDEKENLRYNSPSKIQDSLSLKTDWSPMLKGNGVSGIELTELSHYSNGIVLKPKRHLILIPIFSMLLGGFLVCQVLKTSNFLQNIDFFSTDTIGLFLSFLTAIVGVLIYIISSKEISITKETICWKGNFLQRFFDSHDNSTIINSDVLAIQLIKKTFNSSSDSESSFSFELNIIKKNLERRHLTQYTKLDNLRRDADSISAFLKVSLWDGIKE